MIDYIKEFFILITDKSKSWGYKTAVFITIITLLFTLDFIFSISYNSHLNNKLNQLEKVETLKKLYKKNSEESKMLDKIKVDAIANRHYTEIIADVLNEQFGTYTEEPISNSSENSSSKSLLWTLVSANFLFIFALPILLFSPFLSKNKLTTNVITGWISSLVLLSVMVSISTWLAYQVPLILGSSLYNYALNFLIHSLFWGGIYLMGKKKT